MATEADTCRKYVLPKLYAAGWNDDQISEQRTFTDGRIMVAGVKVWRRPQKRADYLLRYRPDFMLAVVAAKASHKNRGDGLQQAKDYAQVLDVKFAYATNGHGIVEHDFLTGKETNLDAFPKPDELWKRLQTTIGLKGEDQEQRFLAPTLPVPGKPLRYYQEIALNRVIQAILTGQKRVLVNMATGLVTQPEMQGKRRKVVRFRPVFRIHHLRHSFASHLVSKGESLHIVGKLLGHTQPQTTNRYAHLADGALRDAVTRFGEIWKGTSTKKRARAAGA